jgi:hypothetical protein
LSIFRGHYPTANDFGSEVIPMAAKDYNVQVFNTARVQIAKRYILEIYQKDPKNLPVSFLFNISCNKCGF